MNEKYLDYEGLEYLWSKLKRKAKEYAYINDKNVVIGDNSVTIPDVNLETKRAVEAEEEISNNFYNYYTKEEADKKFITETTDPGNCYTKTESDEKFLSKTDAENTYQPKGEYLTEHLDISQLVTKEELSNKIEKVEVVKESDLQYILKVDEVKVGEINIPKDLFLKEVAYNSSTKELIFTFDTTNGIVITKVKIDDLVDTYLDGKGLKLNNNKFEVEIDPNSESYLTVSPNGISINGIDSALFEKANVSDVYTKSEADSTFLLEHLNISGLATKTELNSISNRVSSNESAISIINGESEGSIKKALVDANTYTDTKISNITSELAKKANSSDVYTKTEIDNKGFLTEHLDVSEFATKTELKNVQDKVDKKIEKVELIKGDSDLIYDLFVDGQKISTLNIPEDLFLKSVDYNEKELIFVFNTTEGETITRIDISDLVDVYTAGDGLDLTNNKFSVVIDKNSESYLQLTKEGLKIFGIDSALAKKANVGVSYTKSESDARYLQEHQDISNLATKTELSTEKSRAEKAESDLNTFISNEKERAESAETLLSEKWNALSTNKADKTDLTAEETRATKAEQDILTELSNYKESNDKALLDEITRATNAESQLTTDIEKEISDREAAVSSEKKRAEQAEKTLLDNIDSLDSSKADKSQLLQSDWKVTDTESLAFIKNKPTKLSDFTNDIGAVTDVSDKVDVSQLDNYYTKTEADSKFLTKHQNITGKANKDEMSVSTSNDKTTITLKQGLSTTVINKHLDISGKADKTELENYYTKTEADNKFLIEHLDLSELTTAINNEISARQSADTTLLNNIDLKANKTSVYTKTESDNKYLPKGNYLTEHLSLADYATYDDLLKVLGEEDLTSVADNPIIPRIELLEENTSVISSKADKSNTVTNVTYSNKKITKTINGVTSNVVTADKIILDAGALTSHLSLAGLVSNAAYNSSTKRINFTDKDGTQVCYVDASDFIKDGMVSNVSITNGNLVVTFNTDAGKDPISIPITSIFNASNYYTKTDTDNKFLTKTDAAATYLTSHQDVSGKANKSEMNVSTNGDKTTITLKSGTSATVLNAHQDISGKANKATTLSGYGITDGVNAVTVTGTGNAVTTASVSGHTITLTKGSTFLTSHLDISGKADTSLAISNISRSGTTFTATRADGTTFTFTLLDNNTWKAANTSLEGYVPKLALASTATIASQANEYVLTYINGTETAPVWRKLPTLAFANTNTWRNVYTGGVSRVGTGIGTKAINFVAGSNVSISYLAAGTGDNLSGSADYFSVKIAATNTWTAWKGATSSAAGTAGYMPAPTAAQYQQFLRGDGTWVSLNNYSLPAATTSALGGLKVSNKLTSALTLTSGNGTTANRFYGVLMDSNNVAFVNVPWTNTTYTNFVKSGADAKAGLVPSPGTTAGTAKYLREDATWQTPPNNAVTLTATTTSAAYELLFSNTADNTTRTEGARKTSTLTYNPSTKALSTGGTVNGYTLNAASAKGVDTSIDAASTSANLPTSAAVAAFVEGKKYLTAHLSLANYVTLNTAQTITAKKTFSAAPLIDISSTDIADKAQATLLSARYKSKLQFAEVPIIAALGSNQTNSYNFDIRVGSTSGALWLSAGESSLVFNTKLNIENTEDIWLTADGKVRFYTGAANDCSSYTNTANITTEGILPGTDNARNLGSSSLKWSNLYAVTGNYTGLIKSTLATGTAPITVTSTTVCTNLNANFVGGYSQDKLMRYLSSYNLENNLTGNWVIPINPHTGMENLYGAILLWSNTCSVAPDTTNANNNWYYLLLGTTTTDLRWRRRTNGGEWNAWETLVDSNNYTSWCANKTLSNVTIPNHTANDTEYQPVWFNGSAEIYSSSNFTYNPKKNQITAALFNGFANHCRGYATSRVTTAVTRWHKIATLTITRLYRYSGVLLSVTDCALVTSTAVSGIISAKIQQLAAMGTASNKVIELVAGNLTPDIVKGVYTTTSSATTLDIYIAGDLYVTYLVTCLARGDGVTLGTSSTYSDTALSWNVTPVIANHASKLGTATVGSTTKGIYLNAGTATAMTYSLSANVPAGAANRIVYFSGANQLASDSKIEILNTTNSLSKDVYGLYIHGSGFGKPEDLLSNKSGVFSYGDGGPQIRFNCSGLNLALIATHYDTAGANASLHLVSDLSRVCFTTQEIVAKTRLTIGANVPNTSYALHVTGDIYSTAKMYSASDIRYKKIINNIKNIDNNLVASLPLFTFAWKNKDDSPIQLGTSALAVNKIFPELVTRSDVWGVSYDVLGTAIGILNSRTLSKHEKEIEKLKKEIKKLKNIIKNYECNDYKD